MKIIDCIQGSQEWHDARAGRVTGSRVADIVRRTKSGVSASRNTYMGELVAERLSGFAAENGFKSKAMEWGNETEALACDNYAFIHGIEPVKVGFVLHPKIEGAGVSPDRLVGDDGMIETKCPNTATHIKYLLTENIDADYHTQMQWQMGTCERQWCDFLSFDPRLPAEMQMCVIRVKRDPIRIAELENAVRVFIAELDDLVLKLRARFMPMAAE